MDFLANRRKTLLALCLYCPLKAGLMIYAGLHGWLPYVFAFMTLLLLTGIAWSFHEDRKAGTYVTVPALVIAVLLVLHGLASRRHKPDRNRDP